MGRLTEEMKRTVEDQRLAFVATVDADGTPNLSPKGTIALLDDDHLMFADLASPRTITNLRRHPGIEVCRACARADPPHRRHRARAMPPARLTR